MLNSKIEKKITEEIISDLEKGRKNFDKPHTLAVVYWMKYLLRKINKKTLDPKILVISAYAHDWGYVGLFSKKNSDSLENITDMKLLHMEIGAKKIERLLRGSFISFFNDQQIRRIAHLVRVHDKIEELRDEDEILLMEADTLGSLDTDRVRPTFNKKDNNDFFKNEILNRRFKYFRHQEALKIGRILLKKRESFYENENGLS